MKISTKGRYGLRALVDLTYHCANGHVSLVQIAERQKISLNYLEQVFSALRKAGLVNSVKGAQGGYILAKAPKDITAGDILRVLEGEFSIVDDLEQNQSPGQLAIRHLVWEPINLKVRQYMYNTTLEDLVREYRMLNELSDESMYYI